MMRSSKTFYQAGMTLVEIMIALVIGLVVTLAVMSVMSVSEGRKRTTTSANDMSQSGAFALYQIDKLIRSAGSGFGQLPQYKPAVFPLGCKLNASKGGAQIWPGTTTLQSPFDTVSKNYRLAPIIITKGAATASDVLITMAGSSGYGEIPIRLNATPAAPSISMATTFSFNANDFVLLYEPTSPASCLLEQVATSFVANSTPLTLGGTFYTTNGVDRNLGNFSVAAVAVNLGQKPAFNLLAVGSNYTLYNFDLINSDPTATPNIVADGVYDLRAVYGIDAANGTLPGPITWVSPGTSPYTSAELMDGSAAAAARLQTIKAIRIGLIMRSPLLEKEIPKAGGGTQPVSPATFTLFSDLETATPGITYTKNVAAADRNYRYRVFETLIPVRNLMLSRP
ncbi:PilW family protein [Undibacterium sp.]|uniref:PilW family protein n=1 Tax=Undibacterium sp. TaxID=1914977 RepID=UPI00374D4A96